MKNILLIGLNRLGSLLAMQLHAQGHQIMAVDREEDRINANMPYVTDAQIGDSTNEAFLRSLGIDFVIAASSARIAHTLESASIISS